MSESVGRISLLRLTSFITAISGVLAAWVWQQGQPLDVYGIFERLFVFHDSWAAAVMLVVIAVAAAAPIGDAGAGAVASAIARHPWWTSLVVFLVCAVAARYAYHTHPLSMDEYAAVMQAGIFAGGDLLWQVPRELAERMFMPEFQGVFYMVDVYSGIAASVYWPGYALLMTPFVWLGVPWLLNPLLTGLTVPVLIAVARRVGPTVDPGGWAVLLALASPVIILNGASFYSLPAHLLFNLIFVLLLLRRNGPSTFAAGLAGGFACVLHNPVPHCLFVLPWLWWMWRGGASRVRWGQLAAGYLPCTLVLGLGWAALVAGIDGGTIGPTTAKGTDFINVMGFWLAKLGQVLTLPSPDLLLDRVIGAAKLWLWSAPGLVILAVWSWRDARPEARVLAASLLATLGGFLFVPFDQGHGWGFRYAHPAWGAIPVLAATLVVVRAKARGANDPLVALVGRLVILSLCVLLPFRLMQAEAFIGSHLSHRWRAPAEGRWLVFVRRQDWYSMDLVQNLPDDTRVTYLASFGERSDGRFVASHFRTAQRVSADARGSLWRLEEPAAGRRRIPTPQL